MKKNILFIVFLVLVSCKTIEVSSQFDRSTSVDQFFSFDWVPGLFDEGTNSYLKQQTKQLLKTQTLREMIFKGFSLEQKQPEVLVNIETISPEKKEPGNAKKMGFKYWNGYDSMQLYYPGDLIIEMIDTSSETVIWQARAKKAVTGNLIKEEEISKVLKEMFATL